MRTAIILTGIYALSLGLLLATSLRYAGTGDGGEIARAREIQVNGWHITETRDQNNTSIVMGFIAPSLAGLLRVDVGQVFRIVLPAIFALSSVLLFLLYRRVLGSQTDAVLAAAFFAILPPTWEEVPAIGKSMIAEPLAILTLLVWFSSWRSRYKLPALTVLVLLTLLSHYTVGFMLLAWLGILSLVSCDRKRLSHILPVAVGVVFGAVYFAVAANGAVFYFLNHFSEFSPKDIHVMLNANITLDQGVLVVWVRWHKYMVAFLCVIMAGTLYLVTHKVSMHPAFRNLVLVGTVCVLAAYFVPVVTYLLFLSRWIQISAIVLCPALPMAIKWLWNLNHTALSPQAKHLV